MELNIPTIETIANGEEYSRVVENAQGMLGELKPLDYSALRMELRKLNFSMSENPSLQQLNLEIQKIQAAKDRLTEIMMDATNDYIMRQRIADVLLEGWQKYSTDSSADKRKADATTKFSQFITTAAKAEAFYKTVSQVLKNVDSKHEAASRRVTCFSLALKLRDISRGTPDGDYSGSMPQSGGMDDFIAGKQSGSKESFAERSDQVDGSENF